jgi:hypothetical protein
MTITKVTEGGLDRNRIVEPIIINGDMTISQRGFSSATAIGSSNAYNLDRYIGREVTDGGLNVEQSTTAPTGFKNSLKVTVSSADSSLSADQRAYILTKIEGNRVPQLAFGTSGAKNITLAFYIRSSVTGTFSGSVTNEAENRSFPFTYTVDSADTWERKTVNIDGDTSGTWDTDNTTGLEIYFSLGMGSTYSGTAGSWAGAQYFAASSTTNLIATNSATWHLTGLQIEEGTFDTNTIPAFPFESFENNLRKCMRYYENFTASGSHKTSTVFGSASARCYFEYKVKKRSTPTVTISQSAGNGANNVSFLTKTGSYVGTIGTHEILNSAIDGFNLNTASGYGSTGWSEGFAVMFYANGADIEVWTADAEL